MIVDTHFHAFPPRFLEMVPEASKGDPRGVGFHAFTYGAYIGHLDRYGIDIGVLSNPAARTEEGYDRKHALDITVVCNDAFADYSRGATHNA